MNKEKNYNIISYESPKDTSVNPDTLKYTLSLINSFSNHSEIQKGLERLFKLKKSSDDKN